MSTVVVADGDNPSPSDPLSESEFVSPRPPTTTLLRQREDAPPLTPSQSLVVFPPSSNTLLSQSTRTRTEPRISLSPACKIPPKPAVPLPTPSQTDRDVGEATRGVCALDKTVEFFAVHPVPDSSTLVDPEAPACRRLISLAFSTHEVASLIESIFKNKAEVRAVRSLSGDAAQTFIDVVHKVRLHIPSVAWSPLSSLVL